MTEEQFLQWRIGIYKLPFGQKQTMIQMWKGFHSTSTCRMIVCDECIFDGPVFFSPCSGRCYRDRIFAYIRWHYPRKQRMKLLIKWLYEPPIRTYEI